jgi:hypothetical protein
MSPRMVSHRVRGPRQRPSRPLHTPAHHHPSVSSSGARCSSGLPLLAMSTSTGLDQTMSARSRSRASSSRVAPSKPWRGDLSHGWCLRGGARSEDRAGNAAVVGDACNRPASPRAGSAARHHSRRRAATRWTGRGWPGGRAATSRATGHRRGDGGHRAGVRFGRDRARWESSGGREPEQGRASGQ